MANWFKVYETDLDDSRFQLLVDENPAVIPVWFWILTECAKVKGGEIVFKFEPRYFRMIAKKINQDSASISDALNALHAEGFIKLGDGIITFSNWETRQSEYMRKQKAKEDKKSKEFLNLCPDNVKSDNGQNPDDVSIRGEEKREENTASSRARSPINVIPIKSNTLSEEEVYFELKKLGYPATIETDDIATRFVQEMKEREWCDAKGAPIRDVIKYLKAKFAKEKQHA